MPPRGLESSGCNILNFSLFPPLTLRFRLEPRIRHWHKSSFYWDTSFFFSNRLSLSFPKLALNSLYSPSRPWTWDLPASASGGLGLQACVTRASVVFLKCHPKFVAWKPRHLNGQKARSKPKRKNSLRSVKRHKRRPLSLTVHLIKHLPY